MATVENVAIGVWVALFALALLAFVASMVIDLRGWLHRRGAAYEAARQRHPARHTDPPGDDSPTQPIPTVAAVLRAGDMGLTRQERKDEAAWMDQAWPLDFDTTAREG